MRTDVLVVGAGPAGLAATVTARELGARVTLVDESYRLGGQYLRRRLTETAPPPAVAAVHAAEVDLALGNPVWHIDARARVAMVGSDEIQYGALVLATGAYDRVIPVAGASLPGVVTAGAAQALSKDGVCLGQRVLIAGTGPFALPVAEEIIRSGGGVAEIAFSHWPLMAKAGRHVPGVIAEGARYAAALAGHRVPVRAGWTLREIVGDESGVRRAILASGGQTRIVECDAVAMGYGFLPQLALADIAGCEMRFDPTHRTWFVAVDDDLQTSVDAIFAAGEGTGIGGHRKASAEGRLAAYGAARAAGHAAPVPRTVLRRARRFQQFAQAAAPYLAPPADPAGPLPGALVCRCEQVSVADVRAAVDDGAATVSGVRGRTRLGMGPCQGRMCSQSCAEITARVKGIGVAEAGRVRARTPARPVQLGDLAQ